MSTRVHYERLLAMELPPGQSAFLWGARKTGKSTYLQKNFPNARTYDLLHADLYLDLAKDPAKLRHELLHAQARARAPARDRLVIVDEIQRIPLLLDEIHWLIENTDWQFILCGSSARKLKRGQANLLGGRAWRFQMQPLSAHEIPDFELLRALNRGLVPSHYLGPDPRRSLQAYVEDYLTEEIKAEALVRNVAAFASFVDAVAYSHGQLTNFANIARDCGVDAKTVKEYYRILEDTLLGTFIWPFAKQARRQIVRSTPKFYLFDVGVAAYLARRSYRAARGAEAGQAFEHFVLMELLAYRAYRQPRLEIQYWRTKTGLEVDFVLDRGRVAVETRIGRQPGGRDLRGLRAFVGEHTPAAAYVVCTTARPFWIEGTVPPIDVLPWQTFIERLWSDDLV
jgi:predicted AAA+ superfamily ATPase